MQGYAHYIADVTCVYRFGVTGSLTTNWKNNIEILTKYTNKYIFMYREFNRITNYKYNDLFEDRAVSWELQLILKTKKYKELRYERFKKYFKLRGKKALFRYYFICHLSFPLTLRYFPQCFLS